MSAIKSFKTPIETARALACHIKEQVSKTKGEFFLAISGGSTPKTLFEALVKIKTDIDWGKIQLYWVDERCVPPSDDESNYKMTLITLLKHVPVPVQNIHRMKGELSSEECMAEYYKSLASIPLFNGFPRFDLIILGMGDDGHTASIFPTEKHLLEANTALAIGTNPYTNQKRLTLTGKTIKNAGEIIFHVTGTAKAAIFNKIINQKENYLDFPAFHISKNENVYWYVDNEVFGK